MINRHVPPSAAEHDPGLVTLILCLKRLLAPRPRVHVETWLADTALPEAFPVVPDAFNDDRLAQTSRCPGTPPGGHLARAGRPGIITLDLDLSKLCDDIPAIAFTGDDAEAELVRSGNSRDHRPVLKQVELARNVTVAGGVPIDDRVLAGNVADCTTPVDNLTRLRGPVARLPQVDPSCPAVKLLSISDRAMPSESIVEHDRHGLRFLGPDDGGTAGHLLLGAVEASELTEHRLADRPQRAERDESWEAYQGVLRALEVTNPNPDAPTRVLSFRALVVWSPAKARRDAKLWETNL
jgi:hypothetical protein